MTERQRLITKYINGLEIPILTRYQLFFLTIEKEIEARRMLMENLVSISKTSNNPSIEKIANDILNKKESSIIFGLYDKEKDKKKQDPQKILDKTKDCVQNAYLELDSLNLEDALASFQLSIFENRKISSSHIEKFYKDRSLIHMAFGNYNESLSLSMKGRLFVISFVSAICKCEFELAKTFLRPVINLVYKSQPLQVVSSYELIILIILVCFATMNHIETLNLTKEIVANYKIKQFDSLYTNFCNRNYVEFLKGLSALKSLFCNSLYISSIENEFLFAISENVISEFLFPLTKLDINKFSQNVNIPQEKIVELIRSSIRKNKINGKLDLVNNQYIASIKTENERSEIEEYFEKTQIVHRKYELINWKNDYISLMESQKEENK